MPIPQTERSHSLLERARQSYQPPLPQIFADGEFVISRGEASTAAGQPEQIQKLFPNIYGQQFVDLESAGTKRAAGGDPKPRAAGTALKVGCVLSGGQAPGGHNCICGLYDYLKRSYPGSVVYGFNGGPKGVMVGKYQVLTDEYVDLYRNTGGFDMLGSGRDKIQSPEQFKMAENTAKELGLDGLVVIGGDDSNTNAAVLAEYYLNAGVDTKVIGLPKTIDGDLKNTHVETSFGFDSAAKLYSELIGNLQTDCSSTKKYYHFIRLMGREASHITLECALQTHPNMTFIGEEVRAKKMTLAEVTNKVADMVCERAAQEKSYGVVLIPEGLIDFIPEISVLIAEINEILAHGATPEQTPSKLSTGAAELFHYLPSDIQQQLLLDRDPHGNVQVAKIESERLLGLLVQTELAKRAAAGVNTGKFSVQYHYFGYEGRCGMPSAFDSNYCYALGFTAAALISHGCTGMVASVRGLTQPVNQWKVRGVPLTDMMNVERRHGKDKPVIKKALVELEGAPFKAFSAVRDQWVVGDCYQNPGPTQLYGPNANLTNFTLQLEQKIPTDLNSVCSVVQTERKEFPLRVASPFSGPAVAIQPITSSKSADYAISRLLPSLAPLQAVEFNRGNNAVASADVNVGVVFAGRQSPGGHNVLLALLQYLNKYCGSGSQLLGFKEGTVGLLQGNAQRLTDQNLASFANQGGYDALGRSKDVIRGAEQLAAAKAACTKFGLTALVVVGGPISMSDTARMAQTFLSDKVPTAVIGVPGSIYGDMKSRWMEGSFGFDTACKVYSQLIGNLLIDGSSARKYYYFVRVMGRSVSQIALECALQTQPNMVLLGEEIEANKKTLGSIVAEIADMICERAEQGKNFGLILMPEGLIDYIPELSLLQKEIGSLMDAGFQDAAVLQRLSPWSKHVFSALPPTIGQQLLLERTSSGEWQQSQVETERLMSELVGEELKKRKAAGLYSGSYSAVNHFFGYQARSSLPSNLDAHLAYNLGLTAAALATNKMTGYMASMHCLTEPVEQWHARGVPLPHVMQVVTEEGQNVAIMEGSKVDLNGNAFSLLQSKRESWRCNDAYKNPGPVQFSGPLADEVNMSLAADQTSYSKKLKTINEMCEKVQATCRAGVPEDFLDVTIVGLNSTLQTMEVLAKVEKQHHEM